MRLKQGLFSDMLQLFTVGTYNHKIIYIKWYQLVLVWYFNNVALSNSILLQVLYSQTTASLHTVTVHNLHARWNLPTPSPHFSIMQI
jgi:hypothetical protein